MTTFMAAGSGNDPVSSSIESSMRAIDDPVAYNRRLYAKSAPERLRRINYDRARRGAPLISSLAETKLRIPLEAEQ